MKAVFRNYYRVPLEHIVHGDVISVPKVCMNRQFKCLDCGQEWTEGINSPQILSDDVADNLEEYYDNIVNCKKVYTLRKIN